MISQRFKGLGVSSGIAFGRVHIVDRRRVSVPHYHLAQDKRERELERLETAIIASEQQFDELRRRASESNLREVEMLLEAHALVLRDEALRTATRDRILNDGQNAEWALKETVRKIKQIFDGLDQEYFRERRSDVDIVGDRLMRNLVGAEVELLNNLAEEAVVVAYDLSPADTVALARFAARAFVTETGGRTSHTAILARALNVPSVLGVHGIMDVAGTGDEIVVDGSAGEVVLRPSRAIAGKFRGAERRRQREEAALLADRDLPATTSDDVHVRLFGNIEVAQEIESVIAHGGEGVGLYRSEFLMFERPNLSSADEHYESYQQIVTALGGREVTIRTADVGGDKFLRRSPMSPPFDSGDLPRSQRTNGEGTNSSRPTPAAHNPGLGLRAIRLSLTDIPRFKQQIEGVLRVGAEGPVSMLLPFVTSVEEMRRTRAITEEVKADLTKRGIAHDPHLKIGAMIETPGAVWIADLLAKEADFFSIGTNDLIQYGLAIDRGNEDVSQLYRPCHPSILRMLKAVCTVARERQKPLTLCGEMAADVFHVPLLIGLGLRTLSMTGSSIPLVKRMVRRISAQECANLVERSLQLETADEVEAEVARHLREHASDVFGKQKAELSR
jgi:phosphotransferase system enzyme I (PtsI)